MIIFPSAKINLGLNITEKRADGFHNIETIFYPINLSDALEFVEKKSGKTTLQLSGIPVGGDSTDNLVLKAYSLLADAYSLPALEIYLRKNIPLGAGLGGGSADAAFFLAAINNYFSLNLSTEKLKEYASKLGSDCTFFIENTPCFATGKGDELQPISLNLQDYYVALVKPNVFVSTAEAYANCKPQKPAISLLEIVKTPVSTWKETMQNDFEKSIFSSHSEIENIKQKLYDLGAIYASMSGSGSTVYGLFTEAVDLQETFANSFVWCDRML